MPMSGYTNIQRVTYLITIIVPIAYTTTLTVTILNALKHPELEKDSEGSILFLGSHIMENKFFIFELHTFIRQSKGS